MISRLEWAMRQCVAPKKVVRFMASDAGRAKQMFDRACELIPRYLVKAYGVQSIVFSNGSRIEFTTKDSRLLN
jgi:hypothetical protein